GHGNRKERNQARPPRLQEHEDDYHDEPDGFEQRVQNLVYRFADEDRRVVDDAIGDAVGKALGHFLHRALDRVRRRERIRAGPLRDYHRHRRLIVEIAVDRVVAPRELDARDVADASDQPAGRSLDDNVFEFLGLLQAAERRHWYLERAARGSRRLTDGAGS